MDITAQLKHTPTSPRWAFFEVKASTTKFQTSLEHAEEEQWMFVMDRCRALGDEGPVPVSVKVVVA
ncbi:hypothetical protein OWM54_42595 [Myxococcus sp. MISCRS1]|uniref:hypothetical protein n=1 Tax=Myxococcus sp. MISCRS1 TaxID=2996786 RepID=UPI00226E5F2E|nr:hypothetical protein [Myxococcus sp. MISCRS1]MCY1003857.1 hypothetical protein [Myxococcus sp. MISCRS1]